MAYKKTVQSPFQQKVKVLEKLFKNGCTSEKKLQALGMETILQISGITVPDMRIILELQKQDKANKLFSYLGGGENDEQRDVEPAYHLE